MNPLVQIGLIYGFVVVWIIVAIVEKSKRWTLRFSVGLILILNIRYLVEGLDNGIAFFVGIYDVVDHLGLETNAQVKAHVECTNNTKCSILKDVYSTHPSWGVAFYDRFVSKTTPLNQTVRLYCHIIFNTIAFLLLHVQLFLIPGNKQNNKKMHRILGRITLLCTLIGTGSAASLASEHDTIHAYGGSLSKYGFYSMAFVVLFTGLMTAKAAIFQQLHLHRIWSIRYAGSMYGSFWIFRLTLLLLDPIFRHTQEYLAIQLVIWLSAPLGVFLAEYIRLHHHYDHQNTAPLVDVEIYKKIT
mmetsp:Transcript_11863/g.17765  ORF Transcript_11863/g.17765 Transcript_11863/m.17765 type:complete len:300 (+) Transcript_11863:54-953(+)